MRVANRDCRGTKQNCIFQRDILVCFGFIFEHISTFYLLFLAHFIDRLYELWILHSDEVAIEFKLAQFYDCIPGTGAKAFVDFVGCVREIRFIKLFLSRY